MSKVKSAFFCSACGHESAKWVGKCPSCGNWNTFIEEVIHKDTSKQVNGWKDYPEEKRTTRTIALSDIISSEEERIITADSELNRVLGGALLREALFSLQVNPASESLPSSYRMH